MDRRRVGIGVGTVALVVVAAWLGARWIKGDEDSRSVIQVRTTDQQQELGTFNSQRAAVDKASEATDFDVRPVKHLPDRFEIEAFLVFPKRTVVLPSGGMMEVNSPLKVEIFVTSSTDGLLISQAVAQGFLDGATAIGGPHGGQYFVSDQDDLRAYYLLTEDRTYAILPGAPDTLTQEQAVKILGGFLED